MNAGLIVSGEAKNCEKCGSFPKTVSDKQIHNTGNNRIRKLTLQTNNTYIISTVAGGGTVATDDGLATLARIVNPQGVAIDSTGNIYIAAANNARIMKVDTTGIITTVGGSNSYNAYSGIPSDDNNNPTKDNVRLKPTGITIDSFGNIYTSNVNSANVTVIVQ